MRGFIKEKLLIKDDAESIRRRYKSGIDSDTEIVDLWSHPISDIGGEPNGDISRYEYGRETSDDDNVSSGQSASDRTRHTKRNGAYYKHDAVEVAEIVRRLREMYNIPDDTANNDSNSKIRHSRKADSEGEHHEGDIITDEILKFLGEDWEVFQAKTSAENKAKAERAKKIREQYFPGLDNGQFFAAIAKMTKDKVYSIDDANSVMGDIGDLREIQ